VKERNGLFGRSLSFPANNPFSPFTGSEGGP
jgi:hypothetical protein